MDWVTLRPEAKSKLFCRSCYLLEQL
jgi:hypothetical protein